MKRNIIDKFDAIQSLAPGAEITVRDGVLTDFKSQTNQAKPSETEILAEIVRLEALEPLRLLREQRDTIHLPAWDKDVQIKFTNNNLPIPQNYLDWKQAYLDLPQDIAAGTIPAPTLDANGQLIFNDWPVFVP